MSGVHREHGLGGTDAATLMVMLQPAERNWAPPARLHAGTVQLSPNHVTRLLSSCADHMPLLHANVQVLHQLRTLAGLGLQVC